MSMLDIFRKDRAKGTSAVPGPVSDAAEILARYTRLRGVCRELSRRVVQCLAENALAEGGRKLGFLRGRALVFGSEAETDILMDYCIHDVRRDGRNAVERLLADSPPDLNSDEMFCLCAMQRAAYSAFVVESVHEGVGITVRDLFSRESRFVVNKGLGTSAKAGLILAGRLVPFDDFYMTTGAVLPIGMAGKIGEEQIRSTVSSLLVRSQDGTVDPSNLIRELLQAGGSSHVRYLDSAPPSLQTGPTISTSTGRLAKIRRNDPCPCGSGKRFKNCCRDDR